MTSFFTLPLQFISHEPGDIVSFITSTRPFLNCSIIPIILSDSTCNNMIDVDWDQNAPRDKIPLWQKLTQEDSDLKWYLLFSLSDTLQFASTIRGPQTANLTLFCQRILTPLIRDNPYFTRTLKHATVFGDEGAMIISLLRKVVSLESYINCWIEPEAALQLKHMPLRKLRVDFDPKSRRESLEILTSSDSVIKNTIREYWTFQVEDFEFVRSFPNLLKLEVCGYSSSTCDITPLGSLVKLRHLVLNHECTVGDSNTFDTVADCICSLVELRVLVLDHYFGEEENFDHFFKLCAESLRHLEEFSIAMPKFSSQGIKYFHQFSKSLRKLSFQFISFERGGFLKFFMSSSLNNLEHLTFEDYFFNRQDEFIADDIQDSSNLKSIPLLPSLKYLDLRQCSDIPRCICENFLSRIHSVEILKVGGSATFDTFNFVGWTKYLLPLQNLKELKLMRKSIENWKDEEPFLRQAALINLERFSMYSAKGMDNETLAVVSSSFPSLRILSIGGKSKMSVKGIETHLSKLKFIESIRVPVSRWNKKQVESMRKSFPKHVRIDVF